MFSEEVIKVNGVFQRRIWNEKDNEALSCGVCGKRRILKYSGSAYLKKKKDDKALRCNVYRKGRIIKHLDATLVKREG